MGKTRVHLLAKELGIETKDLIAQLDKMGMRGRKAESALEDDEVTRIEPHSPRWKSHRCMLAKKKLLLTA